MNPEQNPSPSGAQDSTPPASPQASPAAAPAAQANIKPGPSKAKRLGLCILGVFLILFSFSIVSGQSSHGWDAVGIIMILFFGLIGIFLVYSAIFAKRKSQ
jgi:hypothetical protein